MTLGLDLPWFGVPFASATLVGIASATTRKTIALFIPVNSPYWGPRSLCDQSCSRNVRATATFCKRNVKRASAEQDVIRFFAGASGYLRSFTPFSHDLRSRRP